MAGTGASAQEGCRVFRHRAETRGPGLGQGVCLTLAVAILGGAFSTDVALAGSVLVLLIQGAFVAASVWRVVLVLAGLTSPPDAPPVKVLPRYTILVALLDEAEILPQLVERLSAIDYPRDRLEGFLLLEAHDHQTRSAAADCGLPPWLTVLVAPGQGPRTKPRALNHGLAAASGELLTVYDAEDDPDPLQLREAAARFAADGSGRLAALQAPLRIRLPRRSVSPFLDRHFAVEYAALFEVTLPGLARLGLPFPLGGTSNHFRVEALRSVGGWDPHNVTEDADLGFRLWRTGRRLGMLRRPTYETPPGELVDWLPQRTRWLKGFMQTWGVHTRSLAGLGWRGALALTMTLGMSIAAAAAHAGSLAWVTATVSIALASHRPAEAPRFAMAVLVVGLATAWLCGQIGARRAGVAYRATDMITAPAYWSLLSLAFIHAVWRLATDPFAWDKTRHRPDAPVSVRELARDVDAGREAA